MNNIIVNNGIISPIMSEKIEINNNNLLIKKDTIIQLEYINTNNIDINIEVSENARLELYIYSHDNNIHINNTYNLSENSFVKIIKFYNNITTEEEETINLKGIKANIDYFFSSISESKDKYKLNINHICPSTRSKVINHALAKDKTEMKLEINAKVEKNISKCELEQTSKIITLGKSLASIKPNMYIDEHDVSAKHSSIVSQFNNQELFYLMSRGISYEESIKLLIKGFLLIPNEFNMTTSERILKTINKYWR